VKTFKLKDPSLERFQQNVADAVNPIQASGIVNGRLANYTAGHAVNAGSDFTFSHGLGHAPTGIIQLVSSLNGNFYVSPSTNPSPAQITILRCTTNLAAGASPNFWVW
jgi:hypothetical protein